MPLGRVRCLCRFFCDRAFDLDRFFDLRANANHVAVGHMHGIVFREVESNGFCVGLGLAKALNELLAGDGALCGRWWLDLLDWSTLAPNTSRFGS
jgi:hypothetical protein